MRRALGFTLLLLPSAAVFAAQASSQGILAALATWLFVAATVGIILAGAWLVTRP